MASFNKVIILGNVTRDVTTKVLPSTTIADFGICANRRWKDASGQQRDEAMFIDVSAFGKQAENLAKYVHKGDLLMLEARLTLDTWEKDGQKRSKHKLTVENFTLMGNKPDAASQPAQQPAPQPAEEFVSGGDDVPF